MAINSREQALQTWLAKYFSFKNIELTSLTGDAGFRRYFRFNINHISYIAVDAPPDKSNNLGFVALQAAFARNGIATPDIITCDLALGFFCLTDFGSVLLADKLTAQSMSDYYRQAIDMLPNIANTQLSTQDNYQLPSYTQNFISLELEIFSEWLIDKYLAINLTPSEKNKLNECFEWLIKNALEQPQVTMHRDFHSRNLMLISNPKLHNETDQEAIGVIDFQDAVHGPITYDIVSLLRDCYVRWPDEFITPLYADFCKKMAIVSPEFASQPNKWQRWFDLMGLQRHVKASGIFARLYLRDDKAGYLKDIPLTLSYLVDISAKYNELTFLSTFVSEHVLPALMQKNVKSEGC